MCHDPTLVYKSHTGTTLCRCMYNRAVLLEREGLLVEAEEAQRKCLQLRQRLLGQVVMVVVVIMIMTMTRAWAGPHADAAERSGACQFSSSWRGCGGR